MSSEIGNGARVVGLFVTPKRHQPVAALEAARALCDHGLEGDAHARPGSERQLLLMDTETLALLELAPGILKENVTTTGLDLYALPAGQQLRVGEAVLELTMLCRPCAEMNDIRPGLRDELVGRRGYLAKVVTGGDIRLGSAIEPC